MRPSACGRPGACVFILAPLVVSVLAGNAHAEPLPSGAIGVTAGTSAGAGADSKRLGYGPAFGAQVSWQPTTTERRSGWTLRWSTLFGLMYTGEAAHFDTLRTVQMDLTLGVRLRPWSSVRRFLTIRGGGQLFLANQRIPSADNVDGSREFFGGVFSVGIDQYLGSVMFNFDVRGGMIGDGPGMVGLMIGIAATGP